MKNALTGEDVDIAPLIKLMRDYDEYPTASMMWKIWLFCDDNLIPVPDRVSKVMRDYAEYQLKDDTAQLQKRLFQKICRHTLGMATQSKYPTMDQVRASKTQLADGLALWAEKIAPETFKTDPPTAQAIIRDYNRHKKPSGPAPKYIGPDPEETEEDRFTRYNYQRNKKSKQDGKED